MARGWQKSFAANKMAVLFDEYLSNDRLNDISRAGIGIVPEPSTLALLAGGAVCLAVGARRRRA